MDESPQAGEGQNQSEPAVFTWKTVPDCWLAGQLDVLPLARPVDFCKGLKPVILPASEELTYPAKIEAHAPV